MAKNVNVFTHGFDNLQGKPSEKQIWLLKKMAEQVEDILTPEERTAVELMGYEEWLKDMDKWEASRLIGRVKQMNVMEEIHRRGQMGLEPKKWHDTGLSGPERHK